MLSNFDRARRGALAVVFVTAALTTHAEQPAGSLEEIVVTAQKREQNSQDVGISVSAISGAELNSLGAVTATDITKSMPAVVLTQPNGPSSFTLSIRGITQNDFADHQESPAAIYVDDVYVSQMAGLAFSLFDIDRVEVLRGPQGTLFGRNATSGLAQFVSRRPTDEYSGYADVTTGEHNLFRVEGAVGGRLLDGIDGRVAFESNHYDPLFTHFGVAGGQDSENGNDWALRGQLLFKLGDSNELLFIARVAKQDVKAGAWETRSTVGVGAGVDTFLPAGADIGYGVGNHGPCSNGTNVTPCTGYPGSGAFSTYGNFQGYARIATSGFTAKYTQNLGFAQLTAIGDYQKLTKNYAEDSDATPQTWFQFFNGSNVNQESAEVRLNGGDEKLNWTTGVYALRIDGSYYEGWDGNFNYQASEFITPANPNGGWPYPTVPGGGGIPETKAPYSLLTRSGAVFAQGEYRLSDLVGFTLGGRYTKDEKNYDYDWAPLELFPQNTVGGQIARLTPVPGLALYNYTNTLQSNLWSGKAEMDLHFTPDLLAYVSYNRGVKGGGFNAPLFPNTIATPQLLSALKIKPERLNAYEVGVKSEWLDHRLRLNGAAYYYDYKDNQVLTYLFAVAQLIRNAPATHKGGEFELEYAPTESLRVGLGAAYVDAVVRDIDARGFGVPGDYTPSNAPRWSGNALARYTWALFSGHLSAQIDGNYLSKFWFGISDIPDIRQGSYGLANARVNYLTRSEKIEVGASLENLANKHYATMGFDNTGVNNLAQSYPGMPRWFKVHLNYKF
ncbi:MAG: TonB-dependent receptor [Gammaproteobacteria bacterium]|nr:TonB-dependent receptor [Gammaproteobacteria bacterium]